MSLNNKFKKILFFSLTTLIFFVLSIALLALTKKDISDYSPYYKLSNYKNSGLTTIVNKGAFKERGVSRLLAKVKVSEDFISKSDDLGIISLLFNTGNKSVDDQIIFRLKELGKKDWYYEATYDAKQIQNNVPFPFGFPPIKNSKNKIYIFQIESLGGKQGESLSFSKDSYYFTKYKYAKEELIKNKSVFFQFLVLKGYSQFALITLSDILIIFFFSIFSSLIVSTFTRWRALLSNVYRKFILEKIYKESKRIKKKDYTETLLGFLITFAFISSIALIAGACFSPLIGQKKWIPYLSILFPFCVLGLNLLKEISLFKKYFLIASGFITSIVITLGVFNYNSSSWLESSMLIVVPCCLLIIPIARHFSFVFIGTWIFLLGSTSIVFINGEKSPFLLWTFLVMLVVLFIFFYSLFSQTKLEKIGKLNKIFLFPLLIISITLAFRTDSLFLGSSEFHWNYFTGVIQTIRSGGELLWSVPSQYGLLNVLIPSFFPLTSRESFFVFQAVLFFLSTLIVIKATFRLFRYNPVFILIVCVFLSLFYFADPAIIGPTLYPSSSAIRFFPVYFLVSVILSQYINGKLLKSDIKLFVVCAYVLGLFWSAESMMYCTPIYFIYLISVAIATLKLKKSNVFSFLLKNISAVFFIVIFVNLFYFVFTHHFPDWSMFFMYGFGYAGGYGEVPIQAGGIYWAALVILSSILFVAWRLYSSKNYSEWVITLVCFVSLWAIGSYYVGRAVTNNLAAMLPLIFYIFIVILSALSNKKFISYRLLLYVVFLPWIIVGIIGGIGNPTFIEKIKNIKIAENVDIKSTKPNKELAKIFEYLGIGKGARIVYLGYPYTNIVLSSDTGGYADPITGMPIPLALLEEPITGSKRELVVKRFLNKVNGPIYFIYEKKTGLIGFKNGRKFLDKIFFLKEEKLLESREYKLLVLIKR